MDLQKIYTDSDFSSAIVPDGQLLLFNALEDGKPVTRYKNSNGNFGTLSGSGGSSDVILGQIDADGNFQPLTFNGTEASNDGDPETVDSYYGWNGTLPSPTGGIKVIQGGDAVYYKCASVDTASKTWTGYLAVLTDGVYTFEETATTGLTYGNGFTPAAGKIYNADATVYVNSLWAGLLSDGLVFYLPLAKQETTASTGQNLSGSPAGYTTYKGVPCALFQESGNTITAPMSTDFPLGSSPCSLSVWLCIDNELANAGMGFVGYGEKVSSSAHHIGMSAPNTIYGGVYDYACNITDIQTDTWYHYIGIYDGTTLKTYVNGVYVTESDLGFNVRTGNVEIGWSFDVSYKLAALRIYSRAITQEEIGALAAEFTPTA